MTNLGQQWEELMHERVANCWTRLEKEGEEEMRRKYEH